MDTVALEQAGFSSERLERIKNVMRSYTERRIPPGLITVIARNGKLVHFECHGMMDEEAGKPMTPDAIFRIYSMTKPVTAVAVMMLLEEGRLLFDNPVSEYIPEFNNLKVFVSKTSSGLELKDLERGITIKDLLTHTSGLGYGFFDDHLVEDLVREAKFFDPVGYFLLPLGELVQRLVEIPLVTQPGTAWRYSIAFDVLAHLVSVIAEVPFDVFLKDRIFDPLGMVDTGFFVPERERFAALYGCTESGEIGLFDSPASSAFLNPGKHPAGGTGLVATARDYLRFATMLLRGGELDGNRLLGRKTVEWMTRNHLPDGMRPWDAPGWGYGLGFGVNTSGVERGTLASDGSYHWMGMGGTEFWVDPQEGLVGMFMPQFLHLPWSVGQVFQNLVYQALVD